MDNSLSYSSFLTVITILYCLWLLTKKLFSTGNNENLPPSPPQLPGIGNLHQLGHLPHRSLQSLSNKYGPLMFLRLGSKPLLVISSADVAKEAFKTHDISFTGKPELIATKRLYNGSMGMLGVPYGDRWRKLRSIFVNEILNKRKMISYKLFRDEETSNFLETLKGCSSSSMPANLSEMLMSLTNDIICKSVFGKKYREMKEGRRTLEVMEKMQQMLVKFSIGEFIPWLAWIDRLSGFRGEFEKVFEAKDELVEIGIRELREALNGESDEEGRRLNIIDVLLGLHQGKNPSLYIDWDTVKAVIQDVFGVGTKTSAITLEWAMTELMIHQKITKKLQDEIREVMNGRKDITIPDLDKMHYLKAVIKETLRLHPPTPILPRATREDIQFMGYDIPAGAMVMFNLWAIGRDPAYWEEPERFLPERFLNSSVDYKGFDFQLIPFGAGRRICPGISFATSTVEYVLANMMLKFNWELAGGIKGEDLDVNEKPGFAVGRNVPLMVVPTKCHF